MKAEVKHWSPSIKVKPGRPLLLWGCPSKGWEGGERWSLPPAGSAPREAEGRRREGQAPLLLLGVRCVYCLAPRQAAHLAVVRARLVHEGAVLTGPHGRRRRVRGAAHGAVLLQPGELHTHRAAELLDGGPLL